MTRLIDALMTSDPDDLVKFVEDPKEPLEERATLAIALADGLANGEIVLTPAARGRFADALSELLEVGGTLLAETRVALISAKDIVSRP